MPTQTSRNVPLVLAQRTAERTADTESGRNSRSIPLFSATCPPAPGVPCGGWHGSSGSAGTRHEPRRTKLPPRSGAVLSKRQDGPVFFLLTLSSARVVPDGGAVARGTQQGVLTKTPPFGQKTQGTVPGERSYPENTEKGLGKVTPFRCF